MTLPALILAAIAGTSALLAGAIIWARKRQRRLTDAAQWAHDPVRRKEISHN